MQFPSDERERKIRQEAGRLTDSEDLTLAASNIAEITIQARLGAVIKKGDALAIFRMMPEFARLETSEWQGIKSQIRKAFRGYIADADLNAAYKEAHKKAMRSGGGESQGWTVDLLQNSNGESRVVVANALKALRQSPKWAGVLAFNESSLKAVVLRHPPWEDARTCPFAWCDEDDTRTADWMQKEGLMVPSKIAAEAVQTAARDCSFHPVRDYINSLKWDGVRRIDNWLTLYLGVEPSGYARAVGAKWLTAAVARVLKPGCKFDYCLILEGPQGIYKSTALKVLGGEWHSDDMPELGTKDAALQTKGTWIIELAELDSMARSDVHRIKAFMSRATDRFRPPFGRHVIESPRECVFAGSVNHTNYLKDETGGRRFWPVLCGLIQIDALRRDRDQLWAEAVRNYVAGATLWLDNPDLLASATSEQQKRYDGDPWDDVVGGWVASKSEVTVAEILAHCLDKAKANWTHIDKARVGRIMVSLGWEVHRSAVDKQIRVYRPPVEQEDSQSSLLFSK